MTYLSADQMALWAERVHRDGIRRVKQERFANRAEAKREERRKCREKQAEIDAMTYDLGARTPEEREADRKELARISTLGRSYGGVYAANRGVVTQGVA